jgi:anthranilate 1,2-dioxygenase small subunit
MGVGLPIELHLQIEALYASYAHLIDEGPLADWPTLFAQEATFKIVTRENVDRGWPLALVLCEGRAAIEDRVKAISELMLTIPRRVRHVISGLNISPLTADKWSVTANFAVFESLPGRPTHVYATGLYQDVLVRIDADIRIHQKTAICDGELIRNSLVLPL